MSVENQYEGHNIETLKAKHQSMMTMINMCTQNIDRLKEEIMNEQARIKDYQNELRLIELAAKKVDNIEYITIIRIYSKTVDAYIGRGTPSYYLASDWKSHMEYYFTIETCNKKDHRKAVNSFYKSMGYTVKEKAEMLEAIFNSIDRYGVEKVIVQGKVNVAISKIKKVCPVYDENGTQL